MCSIRIRAIAVRLHIPSTGVGQILILGSIGGVGLAGRMSCLLE